MSIDKDGDVNTESMLSDLKNAQKEMDESFGGSGQEFDNNFQKHFDIDGKLGRVIPCIYTGGMFFGLFLAYKSTMARARIGKFLWGQYVIFGLAITFINWNHMRKHYANSKK